MSNQQPKWEEKSTSMWHLDDGKYRVEIYLNLAGYYHFFILFEGVIVCEAGEDGKYYSTRWHAEMDALKSLQKLKTS